MYITCLSNFYFSRIVAILGGFKVPVDNIFAYQYEVNVNVDCTV